MMWVVVSLPIWVAAAVLALLSVGALSSIGKEGKTREQNGRLVLGSLALLFCTAAVGALALKIAGG